MFQTQTSFEEVQVATASVIKLKKKFKLNEGEWLCELNDWFILKSHEDELIRKIGNSLESNCKIKYDDIKSTRAVMYLLTTWMDKVNNKSSKLKKLFDRFQNELCTVENNYQMNEGIVNDAMECHLRPAKNKKVKKTLCMICQLDNSLKKYECDIFLMKSKGNIEDNESNTGTWHPSFEERLVKCKYNLK